MPGSVFSGPEVVPDSMFWGQQVVPSSLFFQVICSSVCVGSTEETLYSTALLYIWQCPMAAIGISLYQLRNTSISVCIFQGHVNSKADNLPFKIACLCLSYLRQLCNRPEP